MGALDPLATGILPIGVGSYTKHMNWMLSQTKTYVASVRFGWETETEDLEGGITRINHNIPTAERIERVVNTFIGTIEQRPSSFSAIKVNGLKAYQLARAGEIELPLRKVQIFSISIDYYRYPELIITVNCGAGTYIRALVRDIGRACDSACVMSGLQRTKYGPFGLGWCQETLIDTMDYIS